MACLCESAYDDMQAALSALFRKCRRNWYEFSTSRGIADLGIAPGGLNMAVVQTLSGGSQTDPTVHRLRHVAMTQLAQCTSWVWP